MIRAFRGKTPRVHPEAFVSEAAYVLGDVEIGAGSGVWPCAVIRADFASIQIGAHTQIEDGCVLHCGGSMEIGDWVTMGHSVVMHGARLGSRILIGNNATVLDGAEVDDFCVIGANALVGARMKVPSGSFVVGVPGEIRPLTDRQRRMLTRFDEDNHPYAKLVRLFNEEGLGSATIGSAG